jgi:uncharacterized protein YqeY
VTFIERLTSDLHQAVKQKDEKRRSTLRMLLASIKNAEIAKQKQLDDADVLSVLAKEVKQRKESIELFKQGNRQDLVTGEEAELAIINEYLPSQLTRDELIDMVKKTIAETGATGPRDKGKVMSLLVPQTKGRAEGKDVNDIVTELLNAQ